MSAELSPRRSATHSPAPRRRARRRRWLWLLAALMLFFPLVTAAAAVGLVPAPVINAGARLFVQRQRDAVPWNSSLPVNVLVLGLQLGGASTNPLTDSLMVLSYDPGSGSVAMLSVPRDLYVEIPGHGSRRINEAFQLGGAAEAMLTVQQNLGIPVNYYALVSYTAFETLIDDVGGVTVDVPFEIDDPTFPAEDEVHYEPFHITKGVHHLDGREALRYARSRHTDPQGDIGRAMRQQQILAALKQQLARPGNLLKLGLILRDLSRTVKTNFPYDQAPGLGFKLLRADLSRVKRDVLGYENGAVGGIVTGEGAQVLAPNPKAVGAVVEATFGPARSYMKAGAKVRVDNGNGYPGAAGGYSRVLAAMGATTLEPGDADRRDYERARVVAYTRDGAKLKEAGLIASMLGVPLERSSGKESAEIVVTLGKDYAPFVTFTETDWEAALKP